MLKRLLSSNKSDFENGSTSGASDAQLSTAVLDSSPERRRKRELLLFRPAAASNQVDRSPSTGPSDYGLFVIHQPEFPSLDIIFVHGLGGHRQRTWSKNHDPSLFWPGLWLPCDPDVGRARIMTFGYNANWLGTTKNTNNVTDFAKELLFEMRFAKDENGGDLGLGTKPIIFVVHSMGGLVVKKACLLGIHDENYKEVVRSISAIIFLSTPHRGTNFAGTLNRVLSVSFQSPKSFVSDLNKSSSALEELNEQFRHIAPSLSLWSFYETLATAIGPRRILVLEKDSSILGYPGEISRPLHADHHGVCKYSGPTDSNYISVRNAIKSLVVLFRSKSALEAEAKSLEDMTYIQELFRNCPTSDVDYSTLRRLWVPETCKWYLQEPELKSWIKSSLQPQVLWYIAPPASGKSVLAAFMIDYLRSLGLACQFFMFRYSDHSKSSLASLFKAFAFQLAQDLPEFRASLNGSSNTECLRQQPADPLLIWRNLFERSFFKMKLEGPFYWVIDALDECESPKALLDCLGSLADAAVPLRVMILSRNTDSISIAFDRISSVIPITRIEKASPNHTQQDIAILVKREISHIRGAEEFKQRLISTIIARANGNFLWTKLVLDELVDCHTEEGIQEVLDEAPADMTQLYQRMERNLLTSTRKSNKPLIQALLEWSTCAQRSLTLSELTHALRPEYPRLLDLRSTINDICGQFIQIDDDSKVNILHQTAREYFTRSDVSQLHIDTHVTHERLLKQALMVLGDHDLRWRLVENQHTLQASEPFVFYAAENWAFHLGQSHVSTTESLTYLARFFRSPAVLVWIHALALLRRLEILVSASKTLSIFVSSQRMQNASKSTMIHRVSDLELLDEWVADLIKLVGKFGRNLVADPGGIYNTIPALCPQKSIIYRQFYDANSTQVKILREDATWNDNLGRLVLPSEAQAWNVACAGKQLAVLASTGRVHIWDSSNFTEAEAISHGEPITAMALNGNGGKLATYGLKSTKIWSVPSGTLLLTTANPPHTKAMAIVFAENDRRLLVGGDDNIIRHIRCDEFEQGWQILNPSLLKDTARINRAIVNSPMCLAFSGDNMKVGVSYRGAPLSVWRLVDGRCIGRCKRAGDDQGEQRRSSSNWFAVDRLTWNPVTGHILGIYRDGLVFKWHPVRGENVEARWAADEIAADPNGKLFATSSSNGSVRIWDFASFAPIYQLSSEDLVTGLAFSPDSRRFYDLRGGSVNAWEPSSLARFLENDDHSNDSSSEVKPPTALLKYSEEYVTRFEAITAFAPGPSGSWYCVGYEDGSARVFHTGQVEGLELARFHNFLDISHISWSADGRYIAVADLAGDIQVKLLNPTGKSDMNISSLPNPHISLGDQNIEGLSFSADCQLLLISTQKSGFVCSVNDGKLQAWSNLEDAGHRKWLSHPTMLDVLLGFGPRNVQAYDWRSLKHICSADYHVTDPREEHPSGVGSSGHGTEGFARQSLSDTSSDVWTVTKAFLTQDKNFVLFQIKSEVNTGGAGRKLFLVEVEDLATTINGKQPLRTLDVKIPTEVASQVNVPLGVLSGMRFAFLDQDLWLCICSLEHALDRHNPEGFQRFYFIPRDWVGRSSINCSVLTEDGTLFWPKDDRVVLFESQLDEPGWS